MPTAYENLELAKTYLDRFIESKDVTEKTNSVRFAAQHIEKARALDETATYTFIGKDKEERTWNIKEFSGVALYYESHLYIHSLALGIDLRKGITILEKALQYDPGNLQHKTKIAEAYIRLKQRDNALALLRSLNTSYEPAVTLLNRLEADRQLGVHFTNLQIAIYAGYGLTIGGIILMINAPSLMAGVLIAIGFILILLHNNGFFPNPSDHQL